MKLNETTLPFLEVDCIQQFGQEKGKLIFEQAEKIYQELLNNADYRNNAAIQNHLQLKLFPTLAYYKALRGEGTVPAITDAVTWSWVRPLRWTVIRLTGLRSPRTATSRLSIARRRWGWCSTRTLPRLRLRSSPPRAMPT